MIVKKWVLVWKSILILYRKYWNQFSYSNCLDYSMNCLMRKQYNHLKHIMFQIISNCSVIFILHLLLLKLKWITFWNVGSYAHLPVFIDWVIIIHSFYSRTILSLSTLSTNWDVNMIELNYRNGNNGSFESSLSNTNNHLHSVMYQIINISDL